MRITTHSPEETQQLSLQVLSSLQSKEQATILALEGDLGSGHPTSTQALIQHLGSSLTVTSPTFVLMQRYPITHSLFDEVYHIDAYRLASEEDLETLELPSLMQNPRNLLIVEWPERGASLFDTADRITFTHGSIPEERIIETNLLS